MEAALKSPAVLGAIVSRPSSEVVESADITLLGRLCLSLPVDLELSCLVLLGVLFQCLVDAVVMAAVMSSLAQDVFSLPSRLVINSDCKFRSSLLHSMCSCFAFDVGIYSDLIAVCGMFASWIELRMSQPGQSHFMLARQFASRHAVR